LLQGKLNKFIETSCLLPQKFLLSDEVGKKIPTIQDLIKEVQKKLNLPALRLSTFLRFEIGEGIEAPVKPSFAEEVQAKLRKNKPS